MVGLIVIACAAQPTSPAPPPKVIIWDRHNEESSVRYDKGEGSEIIDNDGRRLVLGEPQDDFGAIVISFAFGNHTDHEIEVNPDRARVRLATPNRLILRHVDGKVFIATICPPTSKLCDGLVDTMLLRQTVKPNDGVSGMTIFPGSISHKAATIDAFAIEIEGTTYIFPFNKGKIPEPPQKP